MNKGQYLDISMTNYRTCPRVMAEKGWKVVLTRRYFASGANRRCNRWDVG